MKKEQKESMNGAAVTVPCAVDESLSWISFLLGDDMDWLCHTSHDYGDDSKQQPYHRYRPSSVLPSMRTLWEDSYSNIAADCIFMLIVHIEIPI